MPHWQIISGELRRRIGPRRLLYAVVKANAYGHGAELIAPAALEAGADRLAVAAVNEAISLRQAGVRAPILLLGYTPPEMAETCSNTISPYPSTKPALPSSSPTPLPASASH